jgi:hypothetical protein
VTRLLLLALAAGLLLPAAALGGGWATVQLDSTPSGLDAGEPWNVELTVLQHGRTPLEGISPQINLTGPQGESDSFAAEPTGRPGVYRAEVVFPASGTWRWEIWDGFSQTHTYAPVEVAPAAGDAGGGLSRWAPVLGLGVVGIAVAGAIAIVAVRRRRPDVRVA